VGTGFIGVVHVEALRRLGVDVAGVVGSTPERARAKPGLPEPYESLDAMLEADGTEGALAWDAESQEQLWLGHRDRPNEVHWREPGPVGDYPSGHPEGFPDTFKQLYRAVYRAVEVGRMPDEPDFPTFRDGHQGVVLGEAIAASAREGRWVEVPR
jgi:predicted dehydrogenase